MSRLIQIAQADSVQEQVAQVLTAAAAVLSAVTLYLGIALMF